MLSGLLASTGLDVFTLPPIWNRLINDLKGYPEPEQKIDFIRDFLKSTVPEDTDNHAIVTALLRNFPKAYHLYVINVFSTVYNFTYRTLKTFLQGLNDNEKTYVLAFYARCSPFYNQALIHEFVQNLPSRLRGYVMLQPIGQGYYGLDPNFLFKQLDEWAKRCRRPEEITRVIDTICVTSIQTGHIKDLDLFLIVTFSDFTRQALNQFDVAGNFICKLWPVLDDYMILAMALALGNNRNFVDLMSMGLPVISNDNVVERFNSLSKQISPSHPVTAPNRLPNPFQRIWLPGVQYQQMSQQQMYQQMPQQQMCQQMPQQPTPGIQSMNQQMPQQPKPGIQPANQQQMYQQMPQQQTTPGIQSANQQMPQQPTPGIQSAQQQMYQQQPTPGIQSANQQMSQQQTYQSLYPSPENSYQQPVQQPMQQQAPNQSGYQQWTPQPPPRRNTTLSEIEESLNQTTKNLSDSINSMVNFLVVGGQQTPAKRPPTGDYEPRYFADFVHLINPDGSFAQVYMCALGRHLVWSIDQNSQIIGQIAIVPGCQVSPAGTELKRAAGFLAFAHCVAVTSLEGRTYLFGVSDKNTCDKWIQAIKNQL
eukprot:TRINITY_DN1594_c0_g1_i1.p1 TRINITY_DN1594_c0_g1~~TRINITY_DN1594_c0_g1_i1.p1  ORF type:complete len:591 (+),score=158.18 TRINITY_DN1594_c0_g1_i1:31-1803(+)